MTARTINVLFMQSQEYPGPVPQIHASLMSHLPHDRYQVHCAVPAARNGALSPPAKLVDDLADVHVRPTQFGPSLDEGWKSKAAAMSSLAPAAVSLGGLVAYVRRHRIDIVHSTEKPRDALYGTLVAKLGGASSVVHLHVKPDSWMRPAVRRSMHHADALVGVSQFVANSIVEMGYPADKVHAVLNGLELSDWLDLQFDTDEVRREFGVEAGAPLLVTASRLFRWKGQHLIVAALPAVKACFPDVKLLIVGSDDTRAGGGSSYSTELRQMVDDLDLAANVVLTGWRPDLKRLMAASDVFVMPSFEEPFGMVYLEAMSLRKPIIALDNGGAKEIVDHGGSGLLSPPDDVESIAANTIRLLSDPALRQRMGEHGRQRVIDEFSSVRMTEDMACLYERLAGGHDGRTAPWRRPVRSTDQKSSDVAGGGSGVTHKARLRYRLIRTPLQEPAVLLRSALDWRRFTSPQFNQLRGEDQRMLRIMKQVLREDSNCVDVGCHYGSMLSRMTRLAPRGRHVAFEAIPDKVQFLRGKFPDVDVRETALSDHAGEVTFWINTSQSGFSGLQRHGEGQFESMTVQTARLDDVVPRDRRFDLVKVDVEGAELLVLRGGTEFIRRDRPALLFECGPDGPAMFGFAPDDLFGEVTGLGYDVYTTRGWLAGEGPIDLAGFLGALEYPYEAFNFFATAEQPTGR